VWININYRYVKDELRYLMGNADLKALVYQREFSPLVAALLDELPTLRHLVVIEDGSDAAAAPGSVPYEDALAGESTETSNERGMAVLHRFLARNRALGQQAVRQAARENLRLLELFGLHVRRRKFQAE